MSSIQSQQYPLLQKFFAEHYKYELPASLRCMMQSDTCNYMVFPAHLTWSNIVQVSRDREIKLCISTDLPYAGEFDFPEDFLTRKNTLFTYRNERHENLEEKCVGMFLDNEKFLCREEYFLIMQFLSWTRCNLLDDSSSMTSFSIPYKKEKKQKDPDVMPDVMVGFSSNKKITLYKTRYQHVEEYTRGREKQIVHQWQ